jgi:hypothetical protein
VSFANIPTEIREFVARFLPSVEHLETFIVLQRNTARSWSPVEIAAELGIAESAAADVLERLASDNFLAVTISNDILYRFNPATKAIQTLSDRCADAYARERSAILNLVTAATLTSAQEFAEAFPLEKNTTDD